MFCFYSFDLRRKGFLTGSQMVYIFPSGSIGSKSIIPARSDQLEKSVLISGSCKTARRRWDVNSLYVGGYSIKELLSFDSVLPNFYMRTLDQ